MCMKLKVALKEAPALWLQGNGGANMKKTEERIEGEWERMHEESGKAKQREKEGKKKEMKCGEEKRRKVRKSLHITKIVKTIAGKIWF